MTRTEQTAPDTDAPDTPPAPRRGLPVGPLGLFVITAIALAAAGAVLWVGTRDRGSSNAVRVEEALEGMQGASLVPDGSEPAEVGDPAPDVQLDLLDGGTTRLSAFRGRPVVLNFWSSTCAPCLKEMPDLERVWTDHGGDVAVVGVDVIDTEADAKEMVATTGVTYPSGRDPQGEIFAVFGGTALPRTVFIDADGTVVEVHNGALTSEEIESTMRDHGLLG
jgi:peroxiredoxin